jgi:uncharacterized membrane protein
MTNKIKAAVWTLILLIALTFLSVCITCYPRIALYVFAAGVFATAISILYHLILNVLGDE